MGAADEVSDSSDWLTTPLGALAPLEAGLRCQVCRDFFETPMITSCSHTFCSLCIRRYLSQEGRCPACRESDQEVKLRKNKIVEELVQQFSDSRPEMMSAARRMQAHLNEENRVASGGGDSEPPRKRRRKQPPLSAQQEQRTERSSGLPARHVGEIERRSTRSNSRRLASTSQETGTTLNVLPSQQEEEEFPASEEDEDKEYREDERDQESMHSISPSPQKQKQRLSAGQPHDGLVTCPCCQRRMKESVINAHLDRCIAGELDVDSPSSGNQTPIPHHQQHQHPPHQQQTQQYPQRRTTTMATPSRHIGSQPQSQAQPQRDRLPTLNYSILPENALRKKLRELGISSHGSRELMRKRHIEWMNLWNASCDSQQPRSKRELLNELDSWERTLGRQVERGGGGTNSVMAKEFDRDNWQQANRREYDDLIRQASKKGETGQHKDPKSNSPLTAEPRMDTVMKPIEEEAANGSTELEVSDSDRPATTMSTAAQDVQSNGLLREPVDDVVSLS